MRKAKKLVYRYMVQNYYIEGKALFYESLHLLRQLRLEDKFQLQKHKAQTTGGL